VHITARATPQARDVRHPYPTGVWYDAVRGRWAILNAGASAVAEGAALTVAVSTAHQH